MSRWAVWAVSAVLLPLVVVSGYSRPAFRLAGPAYVTEYGLGPDKWATAWLLTRYANSNARLLIGEPGQLGAEGVAFDSPSAAIRRIDNRSAFQVAAETLRVSDPVVDQLAQVIYEIEVNYWARGGPPEANVIEAAFRSLQYRHDRDAVPPECYVAFFDRVYQLLRDAGVKSVPFRAEQLDLTCDDLQFAADRRRDLISEVPIVDVLSAAAAGRKVIFVDVREADEFSEAHIPGALNIPLRAVDPTLRERFSDADYVVSYCVKDFRGYEMAKALADLGVLNSVIMRPYGIKGWIALGLPVTGTKALTESKAREAWEACLRDPAACLANRGAQS
jgi:rhodanese-related sulfurtransferase